MATTIEIIFGEFFPQPATGTLVFASAYASQSVQGEIVVMDNGGQVQFTVSFELEKEGDAIELDIHGLPPGKYAVLIKTEEKEWIRRLLVGYNSKNRKTTNYFLTI